jgi:hypothetical protein
MNSNQVLRIKELEKKLETRAYLELAMGVLICFLLWRTIQLSEKILLQNSYLKRINSTSNISPNQQDSELK